MPRSNVCKAADNGGDLVKIKSPENPLISTAAEPIEIICVARHGNIQWLKDGKMLSTKSDPRVNVTKIPSDQKYTKIVLTLVNTTVNDSGLYTCDAISLKVNDTITVIVKGKLCRRTHCDVIHCYVKCRSIGS
jgi:pimeloyl-CoA synthetase